MKLIILLLFLGTWQCTFCQSGGKPENTNTVIPSLAQKPLIVSGKYSRQIMANPSNADAWLDQYKWIGSNKAFSASEKQRQLTQTIQLSGQYIAASWQFSLMSFIQSGKRNKTFLDAALQSANKAMIYPYAIQFAIISSNTFLLKEYATAFNEAAPLSAALQEYHYNVLMSAEKNAIIYAKGLTDLAPMAVMQQVYGIRKDVRFRYYEENISDTANSYICLSSGKEIIQQYPGAGYSGLLVKISGNQHSETLQKLSMAFELSELSKLQSLDENEKTIYQNYLPFFILLYRSYKINNDETAGKWKAFAEKVGMLTGNTVSVNKILGE